MTPYRDRIHRKITDTLAPSVLDIEDESHLHAGHAGAHPDGDGETHFKVMIVSNAFAGESRVARQRRVYDILHDELRERVHALSLVTQTPEEAAASVGPSGET